MSETLLYFAAEIAAISFMRCGASANPLCPIFDLTGMYDFNCYVSYFCELIRLSGASTPNFDAKLVEVAPYVANNGNMRSLSMTAKYIAYRKLDIPEFWSPVAKHPAIVLQGATSTEAATIAISLAKIDHDIPSFFKELVNQFDPAKDGEPENPMEYGADPNYLIPWNSPNLPYRGVLDQDIPFVFRRHFTSSEDMANFVESFSHFKYDNEVLFESCLKYHETWAQGEEGKRIAEALKEMEYDIEGTKFTALV